MELWARAADDYGISQESVSLGSFQLGVDEPSYACSFLHQINSQLSNAAQKVQLFEYAYGDPPLEILLRKMPPYCGFQYRCLQKSYTTLNHSEHQLENGGLDLCQIMGEGQDSANQTKTRISFDVNSGGYSLETQDAGMYPPGEYLLEIISSEQFMEMSTFISIKLNSHASWSQKNSFQSRHGRILQDCGPEVDQPMHEYVLNEAPKKIEFLSVSSIDSCNYNYVIDYGVLNQSYGNCGSPFEFKPSFYVRECVWSYTLVDFSILEGNAFKDFTIEITANSMTGGPSRFSSFTLRLINPCSLGIFTLIEAFIANTHIYVLGDPMKSITFSDAQIQTDQCGNIITQIMFLGSFINSSSQPMSYHPGSGNTPQSQLKIFADIDQKSLIGRQDIHYRSYLEDFPDIITNGASSSILIEDPCDLSTVTGPSSATGDPYHYEKEDDPDWTYQFPFDSIIISPIICQLTLSTCQVSRIQGGSVVVIYNSCSISQSEVTITSDFDVGLFTFKSRDMQNVPPGQYQLQLMYEVGINTKDFKVDFELIDPCPTSSLTIAPVTPFLAEKTYQLRDPEFSYEWTNDMISQKTGTLVDCGLIQSEILTENLQNPNTNLFSIAYATDNFGKNSFIVMYTEDTTVTGTYAFSFTIKYVNYPQVGDELNSPFNIIFEDPCLNPEIREPEELDGKLVYYTIAAPGYIFDFGQFSVQPDWCDFSLSYTIDDPLGQLVITDFNSESQSFTFEYSKDLAPLEEDILQDSRDYLITLMVTSGASLTEVTFTLQVQNPCSDNLGLSQDSKPVWCPKNESTYWNPKLPVWMEVLHEQTIYTGESFTYEFGDAINRYDQLLDVEMDLGKTEDFAFYDHINNSYVVQGDLVRIGYWKLSVIATEVKNGRSYTYTKHFYIRVLDVRSKTDDNEIIIIDPDTGKPVPNNQLDKSQIEREAKDENKPMPYIVDFNAEGLMTIGWTRKLVPPNNYSEIPETKVVVQGNPRQLQDAENVKAEDMEEMNQLINKIIELEALEVQIVDEYKEPVKDVEFTWDIVNYSSDDIQLKFVFDTSSIDSQEMASSLDSTNILITFWATYFFQDEQGSEVPFGTEIQWALFRQMQADEVESIESALFISYILLAIAAFLLLLLVLTCGPLLPFWMFLNSLQLIVHVPLIRTNIPGNAHYFLLEYLNILRLHFWSLTKWLQVQAGASKEHDYAMVQEDEYGAQHYTELVFSCGYSFNLLPNLILVFCLFACIVLVWLVVLSCDLWRKSQQDRGQRENGQISAKRGELEPWMTNFGVRFLYEVFFEICLCFMINLAFIDFENRSGVGGSTLATWILCLCLAIVAFVALIALTVLFWSKSGPSLRQSFEKGSLMSSIWGTRTLDPQTVEMYVPAKTGKKSFAKNSQQSDIRSSLIEDEEDQEHRHHHDSYLQPTEFNNARDKSAEIYDENRHQQQHFIIPSNKEDIADLLNESQNHNAQLFGQMIQQPDNVDSRCVISSSSQQQQLHSDQIKQNLVLTPIKEVKVDQQINKDVHRQIQRYLPREVEGDNSQQLVVNINQEEPCHHLRVTGLDKEEEVDHDLENQILGEIERDQLQDDIGDENERQNDDQYEGGQAIISFSQPDTARNLLATTEEQNSVERQEEEGEQLIEKIRTKKVDMLALQALMTVEARLRIKLESLVRPSKRYRTLFYGLKRNHPHSAALVHPLVFLLRRIVYSSIVLFMTQLPMVGAYLLALICLAMLAFIIVERQWEDSLISWQHVANEVALYLLLLSALACALPISAALMSPLGWFMIGLVMATLIVNEVIMAYYVSVHLRLLCRRHQHKIAKCLRKREASKKKEGGKGVEEKDQLTHDQKESKENRSHNIAKNEAEILDIISGEKALFANLEEQKFINCSNPTKEPMLLPEQLHLNIPVRVGDSSELIDKNGNERPAAATSEWTQLDEAEAPSDYQITPAMHFELRKNMEQPMIVQEMQQLLATATSQQPQLSSNGGALRGDNEADQFLQNPMNELNTNSKNNLEKSSQLQNSNKIGGKSGQILLNINKPVKTGETNINPSSQYNNSKETSQAPRENTNATSAQGTNQSSHRRHSEKSAAESPAKILIQNNNPIHRLYISNQSQNIKVKQVFEASGGNFAKRNKERRKSSGVAYKNEPDNEDENEMSAKQGKQTPGPFAGHESNFDQKTSGGGKQESGRHSMSTLTVSKPPALMDTCTPFSMTILPSNAHDLQKKRLPGEPQRTIVASPIRGQDVISMPMSHYNGAAGEDWTTSGRQTAVDICKSAKKHLRDKSKKKRRREKEEASDDMRRPRFDDPTHCSLNKIAAQGPIATNKSLQRKKSQHEYTVISENQQLQDQGQKNKLLSKALQARSKKSICESSIENSFGTDETFKDRGSILEELSTEKSQIAQNLGKLIEQAQNNLENGLQQANLSHHQIGPMNKDSTIRSLRLLANGSDGRKQLAGSLPPVLQYCSEQKNWTQRNKNLSKEHDELARHRREQLGLQINPQSSVQQTHLSSADDPSTWIASMKQRIRDEIMDGRGSHLPSGRKDEDYKSIEGVMDEGNAEFSTAVKEPLGDRSLHVMLTETGGKNQQKPILKMHSLKSTQLGTMNTPGAAQLLDDLRSLHYLPSTCENKPLSANYLAEIANSGEKAVAFEANMRHNSFQHHQADAGTRLRRSGMFDMDSSILIDGVYHQSGRKSNHYPDRSQASSRAHEIDHFGKMLKNSTQLDKQQILAYLDDSEVKKTPAENNILLRSFQKYAMNSRRQISKDAGLMTIQDKKLMQQMKSNQRLKEKKASSMTRKVAHAHSTEKITKQSKLPQIKNGSKSVSSKVTSKVGGPSAKGYEDPYDANGYLSHKGNSQKVLNRIHGSYITPGYESMARVQVPDSRTQKQQVRALMRSKHGGGDCLNRVHYKCGCTQEASDAAHNRSNDDHHHGQANNNNRTKHFRYSSNKVAGFDTGVIFPFATHTANSTNSNNFQI